MLVQIASNRYQRRVQVTSMGPDLVEKHTQIRLLADHFGKRKGKLLRPYVRRGGALLLPALDLVYLAV